MSPHQSLQASVSQRAGCVMETLTVRTAQMKSPVSLLSVSHPSTIVPTTPLSASPLTRSAMAKWTVLTAPMKDPSVVMFLSLVVFFPPILSSCMMQNVIFYLNKRLKYVESRIDTSVKNINNAFLFGHALRIASIFTKARYTTQHVPLFQPLTKGIKGNRLLYSNKSTSILHPNFPIVHEKVLDQNYTKYK